MSGPAHGSSAAWLSEDEAYRYQLHRRWDTELPVDVWVMLNPSTADASLNDPTIRRCMGFSRGWGAGGITVVNLFALRATDPVALSSHPDPIGPENNTAITDAAMRKEFGGGHLIVAWGAHKMATARGREVVDVLRAATDDPDCLGVTKSGAPRHPLYVPASASLVTWP